MRGCAGLGERREVYNHSNEEVKKVKSLRNMMERIAGAVNNKKGQTMIEYALVAVLIAIVLVFVFRSSGVNQGVSAAASRVNSALMSN